ncbi:MAG: alkaline phosphatase [Armatimonadetes bacterium]|nr:alkaline phosphatase [Armatimonadota bacterium]
MFRLKCNLPCFILMAVLIVSLIPTLSAGSPLPKVKNVVVMIADGCGYNHIEAASLYRHGRTGGLIFRQFPVRLGMSTYPDKGGYDPAAIWGSFAAAKSGATDSAAAATAMAAGIKTYNGAIGMNPDKQPVRNVLERAEELGKATGVITSVPLCHATPASFVAHNAGRGEYAQIAQEMILKSGADVIMGAGHPFFDDNGQHKGKDVSYDYVGGPETWSAVLSGRAGADADGDGTPDPWTLVQTRSEFQSLMAGPTPKRVLGVPQVRSTLQQGRSGDAKADPYRVPFTPTVPTLVEMAQAALNILDNDPDGLYLMIEGGAVDWAAHANQSGRMIEEELEFSRAVEAVVSWVKKNSNWDETLLIVTGDHETGYLTGPGSDPGWKPLVGKGKGNLPGMEWHYGSHTNSLIPFHARGCAARLYRACASRQDPVRGAYLDNTDIARGIFELWSGQ